MKKKPDQNTDTMAKVDIKWFFSEENLAKMTDEELLYILHDLQEMQKEKRWRANRWRGLMRSSLMNSLFPSSRNLLIL